MAQSTVPINTLVDKQEEQFFPVTHVDAVIDSNGNPVSALLAGKQPTLVSGSNIKSINNESLLGSGNITISGGSGDVFVATYGVTTGTEIANAVSQNKLVVVKYGDIMYTLVNGWHNADTYSFEAFFNHPNTGNFTRSVIYAEDGNSAVWSGPTDSAPSPLLFQGSWNHIRITRNDGKLIPGAWYRITDYVATVAPNYASLYDPYVYAQSANHPFDILVLAIS